MIKLLSFIVIFIFNIAALQKAQADSEFKILLFGDSIIAGYGLTEKSSLSNKLQEYLKEQGKNVEVINAGVSGETTSGGVARLSWALEEFQPDLLFIALGGNDMLRGVPVTIVKKNLSKMLDIAAEFEVKTILNKIVATESMGFRYKKDFDAAYSQIIAEYKVDNFPFLLEYTFAKKGLMLSDNIHPSAAGIEVIIENFGPFILQYVNE